MVTLGQVLSRRGVRGPLGSWNAAALDLGGCSGVDVSEKASGCAVKTGALWRSAILNKKS